MTSKKNNSQIRTFITAKEASRLYGINRFILYKRVAFLELQYKGYSSGSVWFDKAELETYLFKLLILKNEN